MLNRLTGRVTSITEAGNLVTDLATTALETVPRDDSLVVQFSGHETMGLYPNDHDQPMGTLVAKINDEGWVEIEIVGMNVAEMLKIPVGSEVILSW